MIQLKLNKFHHFYIECKNDKCRHNAMVPIFAMLKEYGEDINSVEVLHRARCTKCGFQGNSQMRLVYVGKSSLAQTGSAVNNDSHKDAERFIGEKDIITHKEGQSAKVDSLFNAVHNYIIPFCRNTYLDVEPRLMIFRLET